MEKSSELGLQLARGIRLRRRAFFCLMGGFLVLPVVPIEFTSIITAVVWSLSGGIPALVFLVAGTFLRVDSLTVFTGVAQIAEGLFPSLSFGIDQDIAVAVMFTGNLASAFVFKMIVRKKLLARIPSSSFLSLL